MNFISWAFVLLIIPVLLARLTIGRRHTEPAFLGVIFIASTVFVCWYIPVYIFVLLTSLCVDYLAALSIASISNRPTARKLILAGSLTTNLVLLGFFKYTGFFVDQTNRFLAVMHMSHSVLHHVNLALPIGISFYTFGSMSYTIDVYRREVKPIRNFGNFYFFLSFFPHMVAGPIIRANQFFPQMHRVRRPNWRVINEGGFQIIRGLFLKMVCADNLAPAVNRYWSAGYENQAVSASNALLAVLFAAQIFCDFEGYCSIARGLAYWLGFRFPVNFNNPYLADSFSSFWERWHITLSQWLRDYLYIPLGGNRGSRLRTCVNLMIVLLLGGLWHGAAMTFVVWGCMHGTALIIERLLQRSGGLLWYLIVQLVVLVGWIIFRSDSLRHAGSFLLRICRLSQGKIEPALLFGLLFVLPILLMHLHGYFVERHILEPVGRHSQALLAAIMLFLVLTCYGHSSEFIYFQF